MISRRSLVTAATIIMLGNILSRVLGQVRETLIAGLFGPTAATSAFVAASTVPTMVYDLLIGGAMTAALIPVFSEFSKKEQDEDLWSLASTVMLIGGLALAAMTVLLIIFARPLIWVLAGGLPAEDQAQAVVMVQVVLPAVIFLGLSGISTGILYSRQSYLFPAFSAAGFNLGIIICAVLFAGVLDTTSLVVGIVFGGVLQLALQVPGLRQLGFRFKLNFHHPALRRILILYAPVALGLVVTQAGIILDRNLASQTGGDSMAVMRFATQLVQLLVGLVAMAISYAVLPALSRYSNEMMAPMRIWAKAGDVVGAAQDALRSFKQTLVMGMRLALLVMIPAAVGLVILRVPIIQLLFEHGVFDATGTERTALAFLAYAPQLPFLPVDYLLIFAFYARKNTVTPVVVGVITVGIYLVVALSLMGPLGMVGLCIANAAQNSLHAIILFVLLLRGMGSLRGFGLYGTVARAAVSAGIMGVVVFAALPALTSVVDTSAIHGQAVVIIVGALVGVVVYVLAISVLRVEEAGAVRRAVLRRLPAFGARP